MATAGRPSAQYRGVFYVLLALLGLGGLAIVLYGLSQSPRLQVITVGLLLGLAAAIIGVVIGFVFGIPRRVQDGSASGRPGDAGYAVNTNLEQISDWLTKIIVGVGLVELSSLGSQFGVLSRALGGAMGNSPSSVAAAGIVIAFFAPLGFLVGYVLTRIYLTKAFKETDMLPRTSVSAPMSEIGDLLHRKIRGASADRAEVAMRAPRAVAAERHNREPLLDLPDPPMRPVVDLVAMCRDIDEILASLVLPLSSRNMTPTDMMEVLVRRGLLERPMVDVLNRLFDNARRVAAGAVLSDEDTVGLRTHGPALLSDLGRLRREAPSIFEEHVLATLASAAARGWRVETDIQIPATDQKPMLLDAVVGTDTASLFVEVRAQARNQGLPLQALRQWLGRVPGGQTLLLVVLGDHYTAPDRDQLRYDGTLQVFPWDAEADSFLSTVAALLGEPE